MPASLFHENQEQINQNIQNSNVNNVNGIEEQRALQLALELSMLGLMNDEDSHLNAIDAEARLKKSQNTTECVPVPSSEHVAEIVGRQGKLFFLNFLFFFFACALFLTHSIC